MEATQDMLKINLGSKRKATSIDEETELKRKIPRSSDQTSDGVTECDLNARDGSAERGLSSTENKNTTQNGNQSYALDLRKITNESIEFQSTTKKIEDYDHLAENDERGNDKNSQESGNHYFRIPIESKTESNKDESSKQFTEDEEQIEKEEDTPFFENSTATSIDEETELKRKIPRSSDQTSNGVTECDLNARDGSSERGLSSTENKNTTQNGNQSYALDLRKITNESIEFESTTKKIEDYDHLAENDVRGNDKESQESGNHYLRIPIESKTESNKDESSKQFTEDEEQVEKEDHTTATSREGQASLKVEDQTLETINAADENSLEEREDETPNSDDEVSVENEPDEYIYRILRFNENYLEGLRPKNIKSGISIQQHVESGSWGQESRYISCCKTLSGIQKLGSLMNEYQYIREVVRINITKLKDRAQIIDMTKEEIRERHISRGSKAWDYASKFEEVIIDPTSHVPSECVEKYGIVHMRSFKKT